MAKKRIEVAFSDSDFFKTQNATKKRNIKDLKKSHIWFNIDFLEEIMEESSVNTIYENPREELLHDVYPEGENIKIFKCPEIEIQIENVAVKALLDSGSEITCISQEFYERHKDIFKEKPTLPIVGRVIKNATGDKSTRLKIQTLLEVQIGKARMQFIFIIVPKLIRDCIFGYDAQKHIGMILDTVHEKIQYTVMNKKYEIKYIDTLVKNTEYSSLKIEIENNFNEEVEFESSLYEKLRGIDSYIDDPTYDITYEDIVNKTESCVGINSEQRKKLIEIIYNNREVFCKRPGRLKGYKYHITLKDNKPFKLRPYPISMHQLDEVKNEIEKMLKLGIIRRSKSQYINSCVVVPKKDDSVRLCLDARAINERIEDDHEAPPSIEEILQKCHGIKCMSSLDLTASYWQIELTEESKKYTAFMVDGRVYEYNVCPFG